MVRPARRPRPEEGPGPLPPPEGARPPAGKKRVEALLTRTAAEARDGGLSRPRARAAIDATGFESRHVSRYFVWRKGKRHRRRAWPERTAVRETASHVFLSAYVSEGPSQDAPQFEPARRAACARCPLDTLRADAGDDAEHNHAPGREGRKSRSAVFALNRRGQGRKHPRTAYRRPMVRRSRRKPRGSRSRRVYGPRWQVESSFSRAKRRLGSALRARRWTNQKNEILLRVLTHNLMLLAKS